MTSFKGVVQQTEKNRRQGLWGGCTAETIQQGSRGLNEEYAMARAADAGVGREVGEVR